VTGSGGNLYIQSTTFTNSGTIDVEDGGDATIGPTTFTTTASSVITIGASSYVYIIPAGAWKLPSGIDVHRAAGEVERADRE